MKKSLILPLTRLASSLSLFGVLLCIHMSFTLAHFLPSESKAAVMDAVYSFFFVGAALSAVLCPLFLPFPGGKNKPLLMSLCFIGFLSALEFIFRSLGVSLWLGSYALRSLMAILEGMITTMCYGLFYLAWLRKPAAGSQTGRTGGFCSLVLGAALLGSVLARYYSVPLMETGLAGDPHKGVVFVFHFIKYCIPVIGALAAVSVLMSHNAAASLPGKDQPAEPEIKTDRSVILRLIGLASVFTILNGMLNMQALPLYSDEVIYYPHYLTVTAAVLILGFLAGRSTGLFIRLFLPPAIVLFILMSCLPLFIEHPQFNITMSTLIAIAHYTVWVVFTTAVVEYYSGGFWFYGIASVISFSVVFAFLAPLIQPFIPDGAEYKVLFIVIAAVLFMLLAFRFIFPKQAQKAQPSMMPEKRQEPFPETAALEDIFRERGLSQREIEVANLLVKEGIGKKEIGERLFISAGTAKIHISKIYQKFDVNNQREFMALFVYKEQLPR